MTICTNASLNMADMTINAQYILDWLLAKGWSKNAVCGMLGNMQSESTINPGRWQGGIEYGDGFGLVQWTPYTNYTTWAGVNWYTMDRELERIEYEKLNNVQWINSGMTFTEFSVSTDTASNLAMLFIASYERPADPNQPIRGTQGQAWYDLLTGGVIVPPDPGTGLLRHVSVVLRSSELRKNTLRQSTLRKVGLIHV